MLERLQKILAQAGVASRREAEGFITAGRVTVNGKVVSELGSKADPEKDTILLDGRLIKKEERKVYLMLYKPAGYVTTQKDPEGRPVVRSLLSGIPERVYPVGRLDYNTEGLLLLTNDGDWAQILAHPSYGVEKEYHVRVRGKVATGQLKMLASGVDLDDGRAATAKVKIIKESDSNTWLSLVIHEGRNRQVRRMCEAVSLSVVRLKRVRIGFLQLDSMRPGDFRLLTAAEVARIAGQAVSADKKTR